MLDLLKHPVAKVLSGYFLIMLVFWLWINVAGLTDSIYSAIYGGLYPLLAVGGGIAGLIFARRWGGWRSVFGKGMIFLSLGLFGESFGQLTWTFYNVVLKVEIPYPSIADVGYFSIIPFYTIAMFYFARASGARLSLRDYLGKIQLIIVPLIMLGVSYLLFLRDYELDFSAPLTIFLDFGYPMGEAIMISLAILTFSLSRKYLGGVMRSKIIYIIFAFVVQYVTDYSFLYRASREIYVNGGVVDLMYAISFLVMGLGLVMLRGYGQDEPSVKFEA